MSKMACFGFLVALMFGSARAAGFEPQVGSWHLQGFRQICMDDSCKDQTVPYSFIITSVPKFWTTETNGEDMQQERMHDRLGRGISVQCYPSQFHGKDFQLIFDTGSKTNIAGNISLRLLIDGADGLVLNGEVDRDSLGPPTRIVAPMTENDVSALAGASRSITVTVPSLPAYTSPADGAAAGISMFKIACAWRPSQK
jgi:hypothetical protein